MVCNRACEILLKCVHIVPNETSVVQFCQRATVAFFSGEIRKSSATCNEILQGSFIQIKNKASSTPSIQLASSCKVY